MGVLKSIGLAVLAILGVCLSLGVGLVATIIGASISTIALGGLVITIIVVGIQEYLEKPPKDGST